MTEATTWYAATAVASPERPALSHDLDVDVCVIGAGLAGLTVAREGARRGWSVAVLEAGEGAGGGSRPERGGVLPARSRAARRRAGWGATPPPRSTRGGGARGGWRGRA